MNNKKTDYDLFCEKIESSTTAYRYDEAQHGDEVISFQSYGLSADQVEYFWNRYKRQRSREHKKYGKTWRKWYRFSCRSASLLRA